MLTNPHKSPRRISKRNLANPSERQREEKEERSGDKAFWNPSWVMKDSSLKIPCGWQRFLAESPLRIPEKETERERERRREMFKKIFRIPPPRPPPSFQLALFKILGRIPENPIAWSCYLIHASVETKRKRGRWGDVEGALRGGEGLDTRFGVRHFVWANLCCWLSSGPQPSSFPSSFSFSKAIREIPHGEKK